MQPHYGPTNPSPEEQAASGVRRYVRLVELKPEYEEQYRAMHGNVWPEVVAALGRAKIGNYSIHIAELAGVKYLIAYFEYTGDDPARDFGAVAEDPTTRDRWWPITDSFQRRISGTPDGEQWLPAEMVMWLA